MPVQLQLGLEVIHSYKRLAYTPWHAIAEFVDNSTQSYFNNRELLNEAYARSGEKLDIGVVYERDSGLIRISDNAMGMSLAELNQALIVGKPPSDTSGRSKYGMGMKTAACWLGNDWSVRTKKLGETEEHTIRVNVDAVAGGVNDLPHQVNSERPKGDHDTIIEIRNLNKVFQGRTLGRIKDFLRSMYRQDLRNELATIRWQGTLLTWQDSDFRFLKAPDGSDYKLPFEFTVGRESGKKAVWGWVGILERGSRANAGFSILHAGRVVKGWPDSWRPESLYGQIQGSNDLVNQRLLGEIHLDPFEVSHTKDDILWFGDEEEQVQDELKRICGEYAAVARNTRTTRRQTGPSEVEIRAAVDELVQELESVEIKDAVNLTEVLPPEVAQAAARHVIDAVSGREPTYTADLGSVEVMGYLLADGSPNDPYVVVDSTQPRRVMVSVNRLHPHFAQLSGSEGVFNYLRHCTYDAIAEWKARSQAASLDPDTIKLLKDSLLRYPANFRMQGENPA